MQSFNPMTPLKKHSSDSVNSSLFSQETGRQFLRFITTGVSCLFVNYGLFYVLLAFLKVNYLFSSALGFIAGVFWGYLINKSWTFNAANMSHTKVSVYFAVYLGSLVLSLAFLKVTVGIMGVRAEIANVIAIGITTCTNFIGVKYLVFRK